MEIVKDFGIAHKVSYPGSPVEERPITYCQILGLTADNAANNDTMVQQLEELLPGQFHQVNRARCFLHVINLVAKSLLRQFELPKVKPKDLDIDPRDQELYRLGDGWYAEELEMAKENDIDDEDIIDEDDEEGWVNVIAALSDAEQKEVTEAMRPVKLDRKSVV